VRRSIPALALLAGLSVLAAGCGGGGGSSKTSAADWAAGYCKAATTWVTTLDQARASVKPGNAAATPSDAAQQVTDATNTFTQTISGLGEPDTPDGSTSAATAKSLSNKLQGRIARVSAAINTNNPDVTPAMQKKTVKDQVTASLADVANTTATLEHSDAALGTAMAAAPECTALTKALSSS